MVRNRRLRFRFATHLRRYTCAEHNALTPFWPLAGVAGVSRTVISPGSCYFLHATLFLFGLRFILRFRYRSRYRITLPRGYLYAATSGL